jgi:hypothetical protein
MSEGHDLRPSEDVLARLERVCRQCLTSVGVDGAGVSLMTRSGQRAVVYASDEVARRVEDAQFTLGEGPCVDASTSGSPVLISDLQDRAHGVQSRWPSFLDRAAASDVRAVFAFPLCAGAARLGTMDLYRRAPGTLSAEQLRAALLGADVAAAVLLDLAAGSGEGLVADEPAGAGLDLCVHQAAGMVSVQLDTTIDQALVRLRAAAYAQGRPIADVARDVIGRRLHLSQEDA